eukprot:5642689-Pleurochrysis_carterae.AAC.3
MLFSIDLVLFSVVYSCSHSVRPNVNSGCGAWGGHFYRPFPASSAVCECFTNAKAASGDCFAQPLLHQLRLPASVLEHGVADEAVERVDQCGGGGAQVGPVVVKELEGDGQRVLEHQVGLGCVRRRGEGRETLDHARARLTRRDRAKMTEFVTKRTRLTAQLASTYWLLCAL